MPPRSIVGLIAALAVLVTGFAVWRARAAAEGPPFTVDAVRPVLSLRSMNPLEPYPFDIPDLRGVRTRFQTFRGDLSWRRPAGFDGTWNRGHFTVLVATRRNDLPAPRVWANSSTGLPIHSGVSVDRVPDTLSWLHGPAYRSAVTMSLSPSAGVMTLVVGFRVLQQADWQRRQGSLTMVQLADLLVTLVFIGPDGRLFWAQRLHG
jgi:hypothetical protein